MDSKLDLQYSVNKFMNLVNNWCKEAELHLNVNKTEMINLGKRKDVIWIKINNVDVEFKKHLKYLGVIIDDKLNWS